MKKIILVLMLFIVHSTLYIEHCSAQVWSPIGSGFAGWVNSNGGPIVHAITLYNNELIAGGDFTMSGNDSVKCIAKWDGAKWVSLGGGVDGAVHALLVFNNELYVGGSFSRAGGQYIDHLAKWNGTGWTSVGSLSSTSAISSISSYNNQLVVAGGTFLIGGNYVNGAAKWDGANWSLLGSGISGGYSPAVISLAVYNNELIAAGRFTTAGGVSAKNIAKWNGANWSPLGSGIHYKEIMYSVQAFAVYNNELIVGGQWIDSAGGIPVNNVAKWNGISWSSLGSGVNNIVYALNVFNNELVAGGFFTIAGGVNVNYIAKWNGTGWSPLGSGVSEGFNGSPSVNSSFSFNGNLFVGGAFKKAGGILSNSIAKWGPGFSISGNVRYSDNNQPATNGYVKAIKLDKNTSNIITYDSAQIQNDGSYTLTQVPQDSVDIGVYPNSTTQNDWVVTYYPSTTYWQDAMALYPTGNMTNVNIGVKRLTSSTASNSVNGKVMRLTDSQIGNLKDAVLYAKNGNTFVRCAVSDGNGVYHLPSLPTGSIKIICNRFGFTNDSATVNVTSTSNIDSINFHLYRVPVGIKQIGSTVPSEYKLYQNYPNPFNPLTNIRYQITNNKLVTLKIYNILGKEVADLVNEKQSPGMYEVTFDGSMLSSGIYFYKLTCLGQGDFSEVRRMILIK